MNFPQPRRPFPFALPPPSPSRTSSLDSDETSSTFSEEAYQGAYFFNQPASRPQSPFARPQTPIRRPQSAAPYLQAYARRDILIDTQSEIGEEDMAEEGSAPPFNPPRFHWKPLEHACGVQWVSMQEERAHKMQQKAMKAERSLQKEHDIGAGIRLYVEQQLMIRHMAAQRVNEAHATRMAMLQARHETVQETASLDAA